MNTKSGLDKVGNPKKAHRKDFLLLYKPLSEWSLETEERGNVCKLNSYTKDTVKRAPPSQSCALGQPGGLPQAQGGRPALVLPSPWLLGTSACPQCVLATITDGLTDGQHPPAGAPESTRLPACPGQPPAAGSLTAQWMWRSVNELHHKDVCHEATLYTSRGLVTELASQYWGSE